MAQSVREGYRPAQLVLLERALVQLHFLACPGRSSWSDGKVSTSSDGQPSTETADIATKAARDDLEHFLDRIQGLARDITDRVKLDPSDPVLKQVRRWEKRRFWCHRCGKGMRKGARYCDRCGRPLGE